MKKEIFNYKYTYDLDDFIKYGKINKNIKYGRFIKLEFIIIFCSIFSEIHHSIYLYLLMLSLITLILYIINYITLDGYIKKLYNLLILSEKEYKIKFYDEYLIRSNEISSNIIKYSKINKIVETDDNYYIIYKKFFICLKKGELDKEKLNYIKTIKLKKQKIIGRETNNTINAVNIFLKIAFIINIFNLLYLIYNMVGSYSEDICYPIFIVLIISLIFLIISIILYKKGYKSLKHILINTLCIILSISSMIIDLSPKNIPISYDEIYKYEHISSINFPKKGIFYKGINYYENNINDFKYFSAIYSDDNANDIKHEILQSNNWIASDSISSNIKIRNLNFSSGYYLIYNKSLNKYIKKIQRKEEYAYCVMIYNPSVKNLVILEYKY